MSLILTTGEWTMRKTTKSPGERIVKDIKRATRKHYSSEEKIRVVLDGLRGEDSIAELCRPLPGRVMQSMIPRGVRGSRRASITSGPRTSWRPERSGWLGIPRALRTLMRSKNFVGRQKDLKEVVAEQTLELRLL